MERAYLYTTHFGEQRRIAPSGHGAQVVGIVCEDVLADGRRRYPRPHEELTRALVAAADGHVQALERAHAHGERHDGDGARLPGSVTSPGGYRSGANPPRVAVNGGEAPARSKNLTLLRIVLIGQKTGGRPSVVHIVYPPTHTAATYNYNQQPANRIDAPNRRTGKTF